MLRIQILHLSLQSDPVCWVVRLKSFYLPLVIEYPFLVPCWASAPVFCPRADRIPPSGTVHPSVNVSRPPAVLRVPLVGQDDTLLKTRLGPTSVFSMESTDLSVPPHLQDLFDKSVTQGDLAPSHQCSLPSAGRERRSRQRVGPQAAGTRRRPVGNHFVPITDRCRAQRYCLRPKTNRPHRSDRTVLASRNRVWCTCWCSRAIVPVACAKPVHNTGTAACTVLNRTPNEFRFARRRLAES